MIRFALAVVALLALPAAAAVPAWCQYIAPDTPFYRQYCVPPPASGAMSCDGTMVQSVTFAGICAGWVAYRSGDTLLIVCPGRPVPTGYVRMTP